MGDDAAVVANPSRMREDEMEQLAGRLGRVSMPDNKLPESDSDDDEDPVRKPGWRHIG